MMIAHGITSAMMFFVVGVIYERAHHRELGRFGGHRDHDARLHRLLHRRLLRNLGLPGLCGFVGEVMVLIGAFACREARLDPDGGHWRQGRTRASWPSPSTSCFGVILTAGYMLWTVQQRFPWPEKNELQRLRGSRRPRDQRSLTPQTIMAILLGVLPYVFFFAFTDSTVRALFSPFPLAGGAAVAGCDRMLMTMTHTLAAIGLPYIPGWVELRPFIARLCADRHDHRRSAHAVLRYLASEHHDGDRLARRDRRRVRRAARDRRGR
jgi:formate hydrogenlyase subunit 3/multisubunit Na+/H+ antiporter MnhD subunit